MSQKIVYGLYYNSDMTEGRGPMLLHSIWDNWAECVKFMDKQTGIMGRKAKWSTQKYGDWRIEEHYIVSSEADMTEKQNHEIKQKALAKLTDEEKKALGLD
jgi:hypothetical protein